MNRLIFAAVLALASFGQATPIVYSIPIQNASFEIPVPIQTPPNSCGYYQMFGIPGWAGDGSVLVNPSNLSECDFAPPPDGHSVVWVTYQKPISQDLGDIYTLLPHNHNGLDVVGVLTLKFYVANRYYWYDGSYSASLTLAQIPTGPPSSNVILCSTSGIAAGDFTEITVVCPEQRNYGELTLNLSSTTYDWDILFDKASLTFTTQN